MDQPNTLQFNIDNPVVVEDVNELGIGLDFAAFNIEPIKEETKPVKDDTAPITSDDDIDTDKDNDEKPEPVEGEEPVVQKPVEQQDDVDYLAVINLLSDIGVIKEAYDGFDDSLDASPEMLQKLLEHNFAKRDNETIEAFFNDLSPTTQDLISIDINGGETAVTNYLSTLSKKAELESYDVENEYDQEAIVLKWYQDKDSFTEQEALDRVSELKDAGLLEKEAKRLAPKLQAEQEKRIKSEQQKLDQVKQQEKALSEGYQKNLLNYLSGGKIGDIKLSKDEASQIYSYLSDDKYTVKTHTGQTKMTALEAVIYANKYTDKGNIENLALATLLLVNPAKFDEYYDRKATTKVTTEFQKNHKYKFAGGGASEASGRKPQKKADTPKNNTKWNKW